MNKSYNKIFPYIFAITFIYVIIIASIHFICFLKDSTLYNLILRFNTHENLPFDIEQEELKLLCSELMQYISGKLQFLETNIHINGVLTEFYSLRSKIHMSDVRNIFVNLIYSSYFAIAICIYSIFRTMKTFEKPVGYIRRALIKCVLIFFIFFIAIIIFACVNFETFFVKFHQVLFTNDYWLLDPSVDYIICLLPYEIFITFGIRIVITIIIVLGLSVLYFLLLLKTQLRQSAKQLHENGDQEEAHHQDPSH